MKARRKTRVVKPYSVRTYGPKRRGRAANDNSPRPANDNNKYRRITPADVNRAMAVGRTAARVTGKVGRGLTRWWDAATIADMAIDDWRTNGSNAEFNPDRGPRTRNNPSVLTLPNGFPSNNGAAPWLWRHGPNSYPGTNYGHGSVTAQSNTTAFLDPPDTGPQTGQITGQAIVNNGVGSVPAASSSRMSLWIKSTTLNRYAQWAAWERAVTVTDRWRAPNMPMPAPFGAQRANPFADPLPSLPGQFPSMWLPGLGQSPFDAPAISPRWNKAVDAVRIQTDPSYPRRRTYEVPGRTPRQEPVVEPGAVPGQAPAPGLAPVPTREFSFMPNGKTKTSARPRPHRRRPPQKRVKERKMGFRAGFGVFGAAMKVFGGLTEAGDFVEALWSAMPEKYREYSYHKGHRQNPSKWRMARNIYRQWDKINAARAVSNVMQQQMMDKVIGSFAGSHGFQSSQLSRRLSEMQLAVKQRERAKRKAAEKYWWRLPNAGG